MTFKVLVIRLPPPLSPTVPPPHSHLLALPLKIFQSLQDPTQTPLVPAPTHGRRGLPSTRFQFQTSTYIFMPSACCVLSVWGASRLNPRRLESGGPGQGQTMDNSCVRRKSQWGSGRGFQEGGEAFKGGRVEQWLCKGGGREAGSRESRLQAWVRLLSPRGREDIGGNCEFHG